MIDDDKIMELFFSVARMRKYLSSSTGRNEAREFMGQMKCMFILEKADMMSQRELADAMQIKPASLSELLLKLEQKGYLTRVPSKEDKRKIIVSLTKKGIEKVKISRVRQKEVHFDMLSVLSEEEKEQFYNILLKIKEHTDEGNSVR